MENKPKTRTADVTVRAAFSIFQGAIVAMAYPLLFMMAPDTVMAYPGLFLFAVLPIFSFFTSSFTNWFLQYMYCGSVQVSSIFAGAAVSPAIILGAMGLCHWLSFLRNPITQLFAELPPNALPDAVFAREVWGYAFYLFWGGVYGQTISSGMIAACPP